MIVGFDATAAVGTAVSGVGYHIIRLLEALDAGAPGDVRFVVFYQATDAVIRKQAQSLLPTSSRMALAPLPFVRTNLGLVHRAFFSALLPAAAWRYHCDLFHGPAHVVPRIPGIPTVVTIHDMAFFRHALHEPTLLTALRQGVRASIGSATSVIALSENTRTDISELAGRTAGVRVIYGAGNYATAEARQRTATDPRELAALGVRARYVLYVGDFNPRKNLPYLIESFGCLKRDPEFADVQLVLVGNSHNARPALQDKAQACGLQPSDVIFTGRVTDVQLPLLYRNATAFALCSLMEGFTLVTLEAMSYGVPVVATRTSSIAEGTGDAAELVPLDSPDAVAAGLRAAMTPGDRRDEMIALGSERVRKFSWAAAAAQTLDVYRGTMAAARGQRP